MIIIGGSLDADTYAVETTGQLPNLDTIECDQQGGIALFDLSEYTWGSYYNVNASSYEVTMKVTERIGERKCSKRILLVLRKHGPTYIRRNGGATLAVPATGLDHPAISAMFYPPPTMSTPPYPPTQPKVTNTGSIVGPVVGVATNSILMVLAV
jgi:hypothetical protein